MALKNNTLLLVAAAALAVWYLTKNQAPAAPPPDPRAIAEAAADIVRSTMQTGRAPDPVTMESLLAGMTGKEKYALARELEYQAGTLPRPQGGQASAITGEVISAADMAYRSAQEMSAAQAMGW